MQTHLVLAGVRVIPRSAQCKARYILKAQAVDSEWDGDRATWVSAKEPSSAGVQERGPSAYFSSSDRALHLLPLCPALAVIYLYVKGWGGLGGKGPFDGP